MEVVLYSLEKMPESDGFQGDQIRRTLKSVKDYEGVTGKFSFDEHGDVHKEMAIFTVKAGQFVPYERLR
jgi:ABC-type branched-subunit amino acid transport system substrate-binding protein